MYDPSLRQMTDVDVDMESVINGGDDFDFEYDQDDETDMEDPRRRYSKYTDSCFDEKNDQISKFSYLDIIPVKPRKIIATQSDF